MSKTYKPGKRRWRAGRQAKHGDLKEPKIANAIKSTHVWGSTQRIRRRHRQFWARFVSRIRRRLDKVIIDDTQHAE